MSSKRKNEDESDSEEVPKKVKAVPQEEEGVKFPKEFNLTNFRTKLRGNEFITELRHFIHVSEKKSGIVGQYLQKHGKPLELVSAFERIDKSNLFHCSYICNALQLVLMEIISDKKEFTDQGINASKFFLRTHSSIVEALIKSPSCAHRKVVLKLLTAIVCLEPSVGRQILSNFDFLSDTRAVEQLLSHSAEELKNEKTTETVRKAFIHFILAYMVEGNLLLIRNILDRGVLVNALVNGLIYDDHLTVCVVLNTLSKYVIECPQISKSKKIQVFNTECTKGLVRLYNWLGPRGFAQKCIKNSTNFEGLIDQEEKNSVTTSVHALLITLLTSRKFGIAFDALKNFKEKHNVIQFKMITFIDKPWSSDLKFELISKILTACPELARNTMKHYGNLVNHFKTGHNSWCAVAQFNGKLIDHCHPKLMKQAFVKITLTEYCGWIKDICLPIEILTHLQGEKSLRSKSFEHRLTTVKLLLSMYQQYCNYMNAISEREKDNGSDLRKFKLDVLDHILLNFPTIENILLSLDITLRTEEADQNIKNFNILKHLDVTLELIILICKHNKSFVNKTSGIIHFLDILRPLYSAEGEDIEGLTKDFKLALELKAVKTILLLSPMSLSPDLDIFVNVFKSFINAFVQGSTLKIRSEAKELLHGLFLNTGVFTENSKLEIDLWLEPLRYFDKKTIKIVTKVLLQCFEAPKDLELDVPNDDDVDMSANMNVQKLFEKIEKDLSIQGYVEHVELSKLLPTILKGVAIGDNLRRYLEVVNVLLYHYLPQNKVMDVLLNPHKDTFNSFHKYSKNWLRKSVTVEALSAIPHLDEIDDQAIKGSLNLRKIFQTQDGEVVQIHFVGENDPTTLSEELSNDNILILYIFKSFSILNRLYDLEALKESQAKALSNFVGDCFEVLSYLEEKQEHELESTQRNTENILKYIYNNNVRVLQNFSLFPEDDCSKSYLHFIENLTGRLQFTQKLDAFTTLFRQKIVKEVGVAVLNSNVSNHDLNKVVEVFNLTIDECTQILESIGQLKYSQIVEKSSGSRTVFFDLLVLVLNRLSALKTSVSTGEFIGKIGLLYKQILTKVDVDNSFEKLEDALVNFLNVSHQQIQQFSLDGEVFKSIFSHKRISKSTVKLAVLLLERIPLLNTVFFDHLNENISKKELVYPLLEATVISNHIKNCSPQLLQAVYQEFKNGFMKTIEKPQKAGVIYKENSNASIHLLNQCMPSSECVDFTKKNLKIDQVELFQIKIIDAIYSKALQSGDVGSISTQYLTLLIQMFQVVLKKSSAENNSFKKLAKLAYFAFSLMEKSSLETLDQEKILKSQNWSNFCKTVLKQNIQVCENQAEEVFNAESLKVLAYFFDKFIENGSENSDAGQYFEMIFSHSKFLEIVLSNSTEISNVKGEVFHLLLTLAKKNPKVLNEKQIPILLGSYGAKLTRCDRYILALLQFYEEVDINLNAYRPFIWGESAIAFYSLKDEEAKASLTHQETSIAQVMSLIEFNTSDNTLKNFPVWRKLNTLKQLPETSFTNPEQESFNFGSNSLEKYVEEGRAVNPDELKLCPKRDSLFEDCYDPAFVIPLMAMSFAPDVYSQPVRPVQNGLLSIVFAALSSLDKNMRLAAGCAQLRYRTHFEAAKFFEKPVWIQGYDNIQSGLENLTKAWIAKKKKNYGIPRVPYIPGIFLSRTFNCLVDPTHAMYKPLSMYLRLKETFNFQCVPEFNVLFYSPEMDHQVHRKFIVEIIRDGMKCSTDLFLLIANNTFKSLMGYYKSTMSTLDINLLILSVISTAVKIPATSKIMVEHVGVISWLSSIVAGIEFYHYDTIEGVLNILNNLWYAIKANESQFYNFRHIQTQIYWIAIQMLPLLSNRVSLKSFGKYLNILLKTGKVAGSWRNIPEEQIDQLINCGQKHYENDLWIIQNIRRCGAEGVKSYSQFCTELAKTVDYTSEEDNFRILGLASLREIVILWVKQRSC